MPSRPVVMLSLLLLISSFASPVRATFVQQGPKLSGSSNGRLGSAVAVSADGEFLLAGESAAGGFMGGARVYAPGPGAWTGGDILLGTGVEGFSAQGSSVALSMDGTTAVLGGPADDSGIGAAWVFTRTGSLWSQQGGKLVGTGAVDAVGQGTSVAISADGGTLVLGGPFDDGGAGAAWVFTRSGGVWSQQGDKLVGAGAVGAANQGAAVSLSADGNTILVGGNTDDAGTGAAWVFTRTGEVWSQQGAKLVGAGAVGAAEQGIAVALSADGNTAIVGGHYDDLDEGAAWIFTRSGDVWSQQGDKLVMETEENAQIGISVAMSADGKTAVAGGWGYGNTGIALVFSLSGGVWGQPGERLIGLPVQGISASQGRAVAVSANGRTVAVGGPSDANLQGAVWMFARAEPVITSALDIPGDQGGWLRLTAEPSGADFILSTPVSIYGVWRLVPEAAVSAVAQTDVDASAIPASLAVQRRGDRIFTLGRDSGAEPLAASAAFPPGTWELVASIPALQLGQYVVAVPTISNAAANDFILTASTTTPSIWYISGIASGQSVDNLAPATPAAFTAAYAGGATHLHWSRNSEPDLGQYHVHRGASAGFVPSPANLIASRSDTGLVDVGPAGSYYKLSALDVNGNESGYALVTPSGTLDAGEAFAKALELHGVSPNPSPGSRLTVAFSLPATAPARLELLDIAGRRLSAWEARTPTAGRHSVDFATDRRLPPGLYLVRLTHGGASRTARVAVVE